VILTKYLETFGELVPSFHPKRGKMVAVIFSRYDLCALTYNYAYASKHILLSVLNSNSGMRCYGEDQKAHVEEVSFKLYQNLRRVITVIVDHVRV